MKTYLDCIPCFLRQALEAARMGTDDEDTHRRVLSSVASMVPKLPLYFTPPEIAQHVYAIVDDITGNKDPCYEAKRQANQLTLSLYPHFKKVVTNSTDPLPAASKLAIAGNVLDLAPQSNYGDIKSTGELALVSPLAITMRMFGGKLLCR